MLSVFIISVAVVLMIALQLFIGRTRLGRAMRSTAADRDAAALMGVNINRTIAITFFIGSALAGAAGVVNGLQFGVDPVRRSASRPASRRSRPPSSAASATPSAPPSAGSSSASSRSARPSTGYTRWGPAIVFGVLVIVLVFRPAGLLGQQLGERA